MERENRSLIKKIVGLTLAAEAGLIFLTTMICLFRNQLTWNTFFSTLFIIGLLAIFLGGFFGNTTVLVPEVTSSSTRLPADNEEARILRGAPTFMVTMVGAGFLAILMSILIPLMFLIY